MKNEVNIPLSSGKNGGKGEGVNSLYFFLEWQYREHEYEIAMFLCAFLSLGLVSRDRNRFKLWLYGFFLLHVFLLHGENQVKKAIQRIRYIALNVLFKGTVLQEFHIRFFHKQAPL